MSKFYIIDTTLAKGGKSPVVLFETTAGLIAYLSVVVQRRFGQTRQQFMQNVTDLGFGEDDSDGRSFFDQMEQYFNIGALRSDSVPIKCNIFDADKFSKVKEAHGN